MSLNAAYVNPHASWEILSLRDVFEDIFDSKTGSASPAIGINVVEVYLNATAAIDVFHI